MNYILRIFLINLAKALAFAMVNILFKKTMRY